jgi:F420-dependent oxidoreductase-like protein
MLSARKPGAPRQEDTVRAKRLHVGIGLDQNLPWPTLVERWRLIEDLGFDSIWDFDHFNQPSRPDGPYFEAWTLLAGLAVQTRRVRIGVLVSSNTFRHPALLAKQAITLDHMSGGRLEVGLGAGWFVSEHDAFGLPFPPPGERVSRFREAVEVLDRLLRQDRSSYGGRYYQLHDAVCLPRPIQQPRPPLMLAGHGPRMLRIIAELGDAWNSFGTPEEIRERNAILDAHCQAIGRDPASLPRSLYCWATQTPQASWADERGGGWAAGLAHGERRLPADPWASPQACVDFIETYREAGIDHFVIDAPRPDQLSAMERFAAERLPGLRPGA